MDIYDNKSMIGSNYEEGGNCNIKKMENQIIDFG